ncbi:MAG: InlB B-repeat-containing protein [Erysipelotrichaceae bacterium]|nr:InlB B-repeat-containing protein [Erysipelotrichaceae bacterium]
MKVGRKSLIRKCLTACLAGLLFMSTLSINVRASITDVSETPVATETFEFYVDDELLHTVILKSADGNTDVLIEPAKPEKEGCFFTGWFTDDGQPYTGFGEQKALTDGAVTKLHAEFVDAADVIYVNYHDDEPAEGKTDSVLYTAVVVRGTSYSPRPSDTEVSERSEDNIALVVTGWKDSEGTVYSTDNPIKTDEETAEVIDLYPVMSKGSWLFFDCAGGVYLDPQFVPYGQSTQEVTTTRDGYTLDGWYDGEAEFTFGNTLDGVKTLTAHWTANKVLYHIEVWQEAPTYADDSYYLEETIEMNDYAGTVITSEYLQELAADYVEDRWGHTVLVLNEELTAPYADIEVNGDGSTVTRIYMQRSRHTLIVYDIDGTEIKRVENVKYDVDDWTYAGFTFWDTEVWSDPRVQEINAILDENGFSKYYWNPDWWSGFWLDPNTYNMHFRKMRNNFGFPETVTIRATERTLKYPFVINNWFEYLDEETTPQGADRTEHTDSDGVTKTYYLDSTYTVWLPTNHDGQVDIGPDGFHLVRGKGNVVNGEGVVQRDTKQSNNESKYAIFDMSMETPSNVFFTRNIDEVRYIPGKNYADTVYSEVPFNDLVSKYPPQNEGLVIGETIKTVENVTYRFMGWSQTENGEPIAEEEMAKMRVFPDKDYTFYGIWKAEEYSVKFDANGGTLNGEETVTVTSGNSVAQPADPQNGDMIFVGWFTADNSPYYFGTLLTKEVVEDLGDGENTVTLYARYSDFPGTPVKYDLNGGSGTEPKDDSLYCTGAAFPVAYDDEVTPPEGMEFIGWEAADGKLYQGDRVLLVSDKTIKDGVILLKARYGRDPQYTKLTYVYDGRGQEVQPDFNVRAIGEITVEGLPNNVTVELGGFTEVTGLPVPEGYTFGGWYDNEACEGEPLSKILLDVINEDQENIVYAKWDTGTPPTGSPDTLALGMVMMTGSLAGMSQIALTFRRRKEEEQA